jgi:glycosidase
MEFHISRQARERYKFDDLLFSLNGNVIFANFHASRVFSQKMNQRRDLVHYPEQIVKAGQINAMGLIDEILHLVIALYREERNQKVMQDALEWLERQLGKTEVDKALIYFIKEFPPVSVYRKEIDTAVYLNHSTEGIPNRAVALEELLMLWIANANPAFSPFQELFIDQHLRTDTSYNKVIKLVKHYFDSQPPFGPESQNLVEMLRSPAVAVPDSLSGQLEYIRLHWGDLLGSSFYRLLSSLDLIKEEEKLTFLGPGPITIPVFDTSNEESERFSLDKEWMPQLVLIAKNVYVWLDQLSKRYRTSITRLDEIPERELEILSQWGFSGLWLIGVWERSPASAAIKKLCGNPEAIASAYSLADYQIAGDLGGEEAYEGLRDRAWKYGIRMGSDMVPNHMGIDSRWVIDHPDRFISLDYSPFPSYTFNGPNLSSDKKVGLYIEDHYFDRTDAAVVFKRLDNTSGKSNFIFHGNDGTSMPWNDTAQLNYLNPEVREAVIQTIINVARKFPIIRFDAAMTLAKQHYHRLWFPEPGSGGDIPSRSEHGLTRQQLDQLMPAEFWREVVDRAAIEAPDTLLLAEAFWLMESYFVRTLGMHRVYNSAFMNLLRNEDNASYRLVLKNTLEFDPEILKRFVNFMNNPDERTAIDQFGNGDKYFGICTMMATLPGLPMFGHGQIEGFTEKYGMEYRRAYWDEQSDPYLVERHQKDIFPLLHKREQFANVDNFLLYDFLTPDNKVNEDVFAFSNGYGDDRSLVMYHNKFDTTQGRIHLSVAYSDKTDAFKDQKQIVQTKLADGLKIQPEPDTYIILRDQINGLEFIHSTETITKSGLYLTLGAYKVHVFMDIHQVKDDSWKSYQRLCEYLDGRGVPSIQEALQELILQPILQPFQQIANSGYLRYLLDSRPEDKDIRVSTVLLEEAAGKMAPVLHGAEVIIGQSDVNEILLAQVKSQLSAVLNGLKSIIPPGGGKHSISALDYINSRLHKTKNIANWLILISWVFIHNLGQLISPDDFENHSQSLFDEWKLGKILTHAYIELGIQNEKAWQMSRKVRILMGQQNWYQHSQEKPLDQILEQWLSSRDIQQTLGINRHQGVVWFDAEAMDDFLWWMMIISSLQAPINNPGFAQRAEQFLLSYEIILKIQDAQAKSGYQVELLRSNLRSHTPVEDSQIQA